MKRIHYLGSLEVVECGRAPDDLKTTGNPDDVTCTLCIRGVAHLRDRPAPVYMVPLNTIDVIPGFWLAA